MPPFLISGSGFFSFAKVGQFSYVVGNELRGGFDLVFGSVLDEV